MPLDNNEMPKEQVAKKSKNLSLDEQRQRAAYAWDHFDRSIENLYTGGSPDEKQWSIMNTLMERCIRLGVSVDFREVAKRAGKEISAPTKNRRVDDRRSPNKRQYHQEK